MYIQLEFPLLSIGEKIMPNNRVFYACQAVKLGGSTLGGVQSVGVNSTFNFEQVFQLGQLEIYENIEGIPEVEVTIEKAITGAGDSLWKSLGGTVTLVGDKQEKVEFSVYNDSGANAFPADAGSQILSVECKGMYLSNYSFAMQIDGPATESVTMTGNDKKWGAGNAGTISKNTAGNVVKRVGLNSGTLPKGTSKIQSINVSVDMAREDLSQLGSKYPYFRAPQYPVEVTSEFVYNADGSIESDGAEMFGAGGTDTEKCKDVTQNTTLSFVVGTCNKTSGAKVNYLTFNLGTANRLTGVQFGGGDAGGGNATVTYSYVNYNSLTVT